VPEPSRAPVQRPTTARGRWTSFVAADAAPGRPARGLHEHTNPDHRLRVEHDNHTLLIHLSDEGSSGWTTFAVDRATRAWTVGTGSTQRTAAAAAYRALYGD
jgi:hypothetical protein